ncbi:MAG: exodeoxyribonuclease VII small subunit [Deltaproteobacteria bacterium]|nr:exodeoxyribonuclease VII small subunit [Deltaproteobacteria bacterium]
MAKKNFEEAMQRLEEIVRQLEEGELSLDASMEIFEEGMKLIKFCTLKLEEAEKKVTMLVEQDNGEMVQVPFNP